MRLLDVVFDGLAAFAGFLSRTGEGTSAGNKDLMIRESNGRVDAMIAEAPIDIGWSQLNSVQGPIFSSMSSASVFRG